MTKKFDPYYKWLGIPPRDQPPHHYRLLGIELFENDRDVIDAAANRVMAYLKDLATGDEAEYSQSLLNEVSRARICLLNKEKKKAYDEELRADLKSKGVLQPKAGKPAAKPPAKKRKEIAKKDTASPTPPPESPWPSIHIDTEKPKPATEPVALAEPDDSDDEQLSKTIRWKLIAAVAAGVVLLAGAILLVVFLLSGSGDDQVASAHNGGAQGGSDSSTTSGKDADQTGNPESNPNSGTESNPETDPETDPKIASKAIPKPGTAPGTKPAPDSKAKTKPASDTDGGGPSGSEAKPKAKPDGSPATVVDSGLPDWTPGDDPNGESTPGKPPKDSGAAKPNDEPSADGAPDAKNAKTVPDDTMQAKDDIPDGSPAKPKPVGPEPPVKPPQNPFQDFPQILALPDLEAADALTSHVLGRIYVPPNELCFIKLRGGKQAIKGSQVFVMQNADGGLAERDWEVFSREGESGPKTKIAHLSIDDQSQLAFQWQSEAKTLPLAAHLRNCAISFNCGGQSHVAVLREAAQVEAMTADLNKSSGDKHHWTIDASPDPAAVKIEITGVNATEYAVQPAAVIDANKGETWIQLTDGGGLLSLKVETEMKRNLEVTVTPQLKTPPDGRPQKFNARMFTQALQQMETQLAQSPFLIQKMKKVAGQATGRERTMMEQRVVQAEQAQVELQATVDNARKLSKFLKNAGDGLQLQFRVFYNADSTEVDLLRIGEPAENAEPE